MEHDSGPPAAAAGPAGADLLPLLIEHALGCLAYLDRDLRFVWVNRAYAEACDHPPEFFLGKAHFDLFPHAENEALFRRALRTAKPVEVKAKPFDHPDQLERETTYWDWTVVPVTDARGEVVGLLFTLLDVTDRVVGETRLRDAREQYRGLLDALPDGVAVTRAGQTQYANGALNRLCGEDIVGGAFLDRVAPADRALLKDYEAAPAGDRPHPVRLRLVGVRGEHRDVELRGLLTDFEGRGALLWVVHLLGDATREEEQLRRSQRASALRRLAAGLAHGLNNQLTAIQMNLHMMSANEGEDAESLADALLAAEDAGALTARLLSLSRGQIAQRSVVPIAEVVDAAVHSARRRLAGGVHVETLDVDRDATVLADAYELEHALGGLLSSAADALRGSGTVQVGVAEVARCPPWSEPAEAVPEPCVVVTVRLDGPHIPPELTVPDGLDLLAAHETASRLDGRLERRRTDSSGVEMRLVLPAQQAVGSPTPRPQEPVGRGELVLVVEDDMRVRRLTRQALDAAGFRVVATHDAAGAETIAARRLDEIDLLVTDVQLRGADGLALARRLKTDKPGLAVVVVSGFAATGNASETVAELGAIFVAKPFRPAGLLRAARRALDERPA